MREYEWSIDGTFSERPVALSVAVAIVTHDS